MFMQFTGQDRAMDTVDVSLVHIERKAIYKHITDRAQTEKLQYLMPCEDTDKDNKNCSQHIPVKASFL